MAASSAASALAFDAGGRRFDIWVGDMTEKEASELLKMHEHESAATAIIENCAVAGNASGFCHFFIFNASLCCVSIGFQQGGHRAGDLVDACSMLKCLL